MDPLSIVGVGANLAGVVEVALRTTAALIKYARDTKYVSSDRKLLAEETEFLSKLLQRLRDRAQSARQDETWLSEHKAIVRQFEAAYDDLAMTLKYDAVTGKIRQESKFQAARSIAKWSFTKSEIYSLLERITRLQQHANMLLSDDQQRVFQSMVILCGTRADQRTFTAAHCSNGWTRSSKKVSSAEKSSLSDEADAVNS